ncbi:MAG: rhomboid family intramembrane serine protease [Bacteroidota bacterium]
MSNELKQISNKFLLSLMVVAVLWVIHLISYVGDMNLAFLGVYPRTAKGLLGILTAPLIHGSWGHLASNSAPLLVLLTGLMVFFRQESKTVLLVSYVATGLWVWVAGRNSFHIGASGVVYALAFFAFFSGVFRKDIRSIALALIVAFLYGGMVWGIFPMQEGVSWESHMFGGIAGIILAWYFRKSGPKPKSYDWEEDIDRPEDEYAAWNYKNLYPPPEGFSYPNKEE